MLYNNCKALFLIFINSQKSSSNELLFFGIFTDIRAWVEILLTVKLNARLKVFAPLFTKSGKALYVSGAIRKKGRTEVLPFQIYVNVRVWVEISLTVKPNARPKVFCAAFTKSGKALFACPCYGLTSN